jgi:hypothetical protein
MTRTRQILAALLPALLELSRVRLSTASPRWAAAQVSLYVDPRGPFAGAFAIFHLRGGEWRLASYTEDLCGPGAELPIPIRAQRDLKLPSCFLDGAKLGEEPIVRDSSGADRVRPPALRVTTVDGIARLVDLGAWRTWGVNRAAVAWTRATLVGLPCRHGCEGESGEEWRVVLTLHGYRRCGVRVAFRWLEWSPVEGHPRAPHGRYRLGC